MSNSYKFYSDTKDIMKKYVNATEGAIIYGISKSSWMEIWKKDSACCVRIINHRGREVCPYPQKR